MRRRIFRYHFFLILLMHVFTVFFSANVAWQVYLEEIENQLATTLSRMEQLYQKERQSRQTISMDAFIKSYANTFADAKMRFYILDFSGKLLGNSDADFYEAKQVQESKEFQDALQTGKGRDTRKSYPQDQEFIYLALAYPEEQLIYRVSFPLTAFDKINAKVIQDGIFILLIGCIIAGLFSLKFSHYITNPLREMKVAALEMAQGNFGTRIHYNKKDTLGDLAKAMNTMADHLQQNIAAIQKSKNEVESIVGSMTNGLIAVDREGKIILFNPRARELFAISAKEIALENPLLYYIRTPALHALLSDTLEQNRSFEGEVVLEDGHILRLDTAPIRSHERSQENGGALAFITDITKMRKLEGLRTDFVANVTHELKTPLTAIRGFIDTLKDGALEQPRLAARFLDIIDLETERLANLIHDILELSQIESGKSLEPLEQVSIQQLVDEVMHLQQKRADQKEIQMKNQIPSSLVLMLNKNRMKQLFINLIDNAIKYNKAQGSILVGAKRENKRWKIFVQDTGIGIASEHLDRIFERFYRVHQGRAREMGGTGLGLSIVKHIAALYGASVQVESQVEQGTTFILSFPVNKQRAQINHPPLL